MDQRENITSVTFFQTSRFLFYFCSGEGWEALGGGNSLSLE